MKAVALFFVFLAAGVFSSAMAQVPQGTQLTRSSLTFYRDTASGKKLDFVITGSSVSNLNAQDVLVNQFEMKSFHNGDPKLIQIIAQAPKCQVNVSNNVASDSGPLEIYTPTTNLFVQGVGFRFTQSNHFLIISNQVETRMVKSLIKSPMLAAPRTNAASDAGQVVQIFADQGRFNLDANVVDYSGNVHVIDPQLDMTSDMLTIRLTTNGAVESILARQNVVLTTTNHGVATGATGFYYVTNGNEMMQLTTDATWRNGDEKARANQFTYDSARHLLTGIGHVRMQWPNAAANTTNSTAPMAGTNGFRKIFADFATLQFPPTNGPLESMTARGNVIIVNQADQSSAMADEARYEKTTDRIDLTGNSVWWTDALEVKAETLSAGLGDKTYHARTNAHFKMRVGGGAAKNSTVASGHSTNQWLYISSDNMEYQTNQAIFSQNVQTRLVDNDRLQDTLSCAHLTIHMVNNKLESAFARGDVRGETAPDASGLIKTIACQRLNAYLSVVTGLMKSIDAHTNVVIEEKGKNPAAPSNKLGADTITAQFSAVTNQIEHAVAEQNVVLDQLKAGRTVHATAYRADYAAGANDQVKLTGVPLANTDKFSITHADYMIWQPKVNKFQAYGRYKIVPIKAAAAAKSPRS